MVDEPNRTNANDQDLGFCSRTSWIQFGYGVWTHMSTIGIGLAFGFSAVAIHQLTEPESEVKITITEASWIASVPLLVSPVGGISSGYLIDKIGRKKALIFNNLPMLAGWMFFAFASDATDMIIGRVITGLGVGMTMPATRVFVAEIALPNMRGALGAFPNLAVGIGLIIQSILGSFCNWRVLCYIASFYTTVLCFLNLLLPESPYYLLTKGYFRETKTALIKFRSKTYDVDMEIQKMKEFKEANSIHKLPLHELIKALFSKSPCKLFAIIMVYAVITQFSGITIMTMWSVDVIKGTKTSVDPHVGNVILSLTRFFGGILCSVLLYKYGRRTLSLASGIGIGLSSIACSFFTAYEPQTVFPQICLTLFVLFAAIGFYTIPLLMASEVFPLQIRGLLGGITISLTNLTMFVSTKCYPFVVDLYGHVKIIFLFGTFALIGTVILYFLLPETKNMTLVEIEEHFNNQRKRPGKSSTSSTKKDEKVLTDSSVNKNLKSTDSSETVIIFDHENAKNVNEKDAKMTIAPSDP